MTRPASRSSTRTASITASRTAVWPTMSPLAKFITMKGKPPLWIAAMAASATAGALISGCRS